MTAHDHADPPGTLGGASLLPDAARWRSLAAASTADLASLQRTALAVRSELLALDLGGSMRALAALAEGSHAQARLAQADLEAVELIRAAGEREPAGLVAVFPPDHSQLRATEAPDGTWRLDGRQRRTVHPGAVDCALVVAATPAGDRLFLVPMEAAGVVRDQAPLSAIAPVDPNGPVTLTAAESTPVGTASWWAGRRESFDALLRDVACWFGACVWLCRAVERTLADRTDPADLLRVGRVDVWVYSARLAMRDAAAIVEGDPGSRAAEIAARRAAAVVITTTDTVIRLVALMSDARVPTEGGFLPGRVAQLQIALRRFDPTANLQALAVAMAADRVDRGASD